MPQAGGAAAGLPGDSEATALSPCSVREGADGPGAWAQGGGNSQVRRCTGKKTVFWERGEGVKKELEEEQQKEKQENTKRYLKRSKKEIEEEQKSQ